jgi:hypothetical protein
MMHTHGNHQCVSGVPTVQHKASCDARAGARWRHGHCIEMTSSYGGGGGTGRGTGRYRAGRARFSNGPVRPFIPPFRAFVRPPPAVTRALAHPLTVIHPLTPWSTPPTDPPTHQHHTPPLTKRVHARSPDARIKECASSSNRYAHDHARQRQQSVHRAEEPDVLPRPLRCRCLCRDTCMYVYLV